MEKPDGKHRMHSAFFKSKTNIGFLVVIALLTAALIWQQCEIVDLQSRMMTQEAGEYGRHIGSLYWHAETTDEKLREIGKDIYRLQRHSAKHDWALQEKNW